MNASIKIFPDFDSLSLAAALYFTGVVQDAVEQREGALVALSGGSTPLRLFQLLAAPPFAELVPWKAVHFFWCDERCVPPDDPQSNFGQAHRALFQPLNIPQENLHRIAGEMAPEQAALSYTDKLRQYKSAGFDWPAFDLVLLGLGADGHTASLFPGKTVPEYTPVLAITADYQGRPARRVTLAPVVFNSARHVLLLAAGADKAAAVAMALQGRLDPLRYPAQRIQPASGELTWMLDAAAAQKLAGGSERQPGLPPYR